MIKEKVRIRDKSFDSAGLKKDYISSIIEFVLNGFEAKATSVYIVAEAHSQELNGLEKLVIVDNGEGINYETREDSFGTFLMSQKEKNVFLIGLIRVRGVIHLKIFVHRPNGLPCTKAMGKGTNILLH